MTKIKILIADDHVIFRGGLRKLLDSDEEITVGGEACNGAECIKMLSNLKPDILPLDLRMPNKSGLAVLEELNFDTVRTRVIVLTAAEDGRCASCHASGRARCRPKTVRLRSPAKEHTSRAFW
jgi:DNA-binding NarL/FixJ family response regulator